ncbi:MAG: ATP-binding protein [Bacteriovoracaceae bacterium]|jgi:predicted AAA+ superfamily ATPase|nr:ATP-binding protein [Bacteriovoracaceae bacterium]
MITRDITDELIQLSKEFRVITVIGPRQSGKTTLVRNTFKDYQYCTLEDPDLRNLATEDPRGFFSSFEKKVIIDEVQRVPQLLSYIQTIVDEKNIKGQFILTGSHQLELMSQVSQSLAGRTAILKLLPLSINELLKHKYEVLKYETCVKGFYPRLFSEEVRPNKLMASYYETYIEKDVRQLIKLKDMTLFQKFVRLLAGRVGQVINFSSLSNDVGVSNTTLREWTSVLEASFIIYKLTPYYENFGKRVIKSPKYYFTDVGLLCYLLGIENSKQLQRDPLIGNIFENLVVIEFLKQRYNKGLSPNLYFFRDSHGNEVDLVFKNGRKLVPIEIKSSETFHVSFTKQIIKFQKLTELSDKGIVIYSGDFCPKSDAYRVINFRDIATLCEGL